MTLIIQKPSMMEILHTIEVLRRRRRRNRILIILLVVLLFLCAGAFVASKTVAVPYRCTGAAMEETLHDGDLTLVKVLNYEPARGDVVVCKNGQTVMFRRVIGLAGDTVAIDPVEGIVSVNGTALTEDYVKELAVGNLTGDTSVTLEDGYVYLLGDNRVEAEDSRTLGPVLVSKLEGKVWFVLSPGMRRIP